MLQDKSEEKNNFIHACFTNNLEVIKAYLNAGYDFASDSAYAEACYRGATENETYPEVVKLLILHGLPAQHYKYKLPYEVLNASEMFYFEDKWTWTVEDNLPDERIPQALIESGAELDCVDRFAGNSAFKSEDPLGMTALDIALNKTQPHPKAARLLQDAGARQAYQLTLDEKIMRSAFHVAYRFNLEVMQEYLHSRETLQEEISPLHISSAFDTALLGRERLIRTQADAYRVEHRDTPDIEKAHFLAAYFNCIPALPASYVRMLIKYAQMDAYSEEYIRDVLSFFIEYNCDFNLLYLGETSLDILNEKGLISLGALIRTHGAKTLAELSEVGEVSSEIDSINSLRKLSAGSEHK